MSPSSRIPLHGSLWMINPDATAQRNPRHKSNNAHFVPTGMLGIDFMEHSLHRHRLIGVHVGELPEFLRHRTVKLAGCATARANSVE